MLKFMNFILLMLAISASNFAILISDENPDIDSNNVDDDYEMFRLSFANPFEQPTIAINYGIVLHFITKMP